MRKLFLTSLTILLPLIIFGSHAVSSQPTQPDYVDLQFQTVPNILLVDITTIEPTSEGVRATFTLANPLRTLYLPFDLSGDYASLEPMSESARLWQSIGMIPPAGLDFPGNSLEFQVQFTSSAQQLHVQSSLINLRSLVFNGVEVASNYFIPGLDVSRIVPFFAKEFVQFEQGLAAIASSAGCFLDTPTFAQLPSCALAIKDIFGSGTFQQMLLLILKDLSVEVSKGQITQFVKGIEFVEKLGNISDGLVYLGVSISSGTLSNRYVLQPVTHNPTLLPPWPPRLIAPLEYADSIQPTFTWNTSPDVNGYELQVDTDAQFPVPVIQSPLIAATSYQSPTPLEPNQTYYWRVRAFSQTGGYSPWSSGTFMTDREESSVTQQEFGPEAIWNFPDEFLGSNSNCWQNQVLSLDCVVSAMQSLGASPQAIAFTKLLQGEAVMFSFTELGKVDLAEILYPSRANNNSQLVLVNGMPEVVHAEDIEDIDITSDPNYQGLLQRFPNLLPAPWVTEDSFENMEPLPQGGQRFIFRYPLKDGCHACETVGYARITFDFDSTGKFLGKHLLSLVSGEGQSSSSGATAPLETAVSPQIICPTTPPSRLAIGHRGRVTFTNGSPTRLRSAPGTNNVVLLEMPEGTQFTVLGGPQCGTYAWWQVQLDDGTIGWVAEGSQSEYFVEPLP